MDNALTDVAGLCVGHWTNTEAATGCTVVLCGHGAVAGVDIRGGAPGTRETALLDPVCTVEHAHAVLLTGGSAFGLAAADGVMQWLEERGVGYDVGVARVPIVPTAVLFDLPLGRPDVRPDRAAGYAACAAAGSGAVARGCVGAGTGATIGKVCGLKRACKGGVGCASIRTAGGLTVAALAVVNAFGNVHDLATGQVVAGVRQLDASGRFCGFLDPVPLLADGTRPEFAASNTTLVVVATDASLTKSEVAKTARMAQDGVARAIRPVHTGLDGDVVLALSYGEKRASADAVGSLAADVTSLAILDAVYAATSMYGVPCAQECVA